MHHSLSQVRFHFQFTITTTIFALVRSIKRYKFRLKTSLPSTNTLNLVSNAWHTQRQSQLENGNVCDMTNTPFDMYSRGGKRTSTQTFWSIFFLPLENAGVFSKTPCWLSRSLIGNVHQHKPKICLSRWSLSTKRKTQVNWVSEMLSTYKCKTKEIVPYVVHAQETCTYYGD